MTNAFITELTDCLNLALQSSDLHEGCQKHKPALAVIPLMQLDLSGATKLCLMALESQIILAPRADTYPELSLNLTHVASADGLKLIHLEGSPLPISGSYEPGSGWNDLKSWEQDFALWAHTLNTNLAGLLTDEFGQISFLARTDIPSWWPKAMKSLALAAVNESQHALESIHVALLEAHSRLGENGLFFIRPTSAIFLPDDPA